ncbi:MAG: hypothetical protein ACHQNA_02175, partial [Acidimicrobiales bacterium]
MRRAPLHPLALAVAVLVAGCSGSARTSSSGRTAPATVGSSTSTTAASRRTAPATVGSSTSTTAASRRSQACGTPAAPTGDQRVHVAPPAGSPGSYIRHLPAGYDGTNPIPVVFDLHGYGEPAAVEEQLSGLAAYGDTHGFATVLPETTATVPLWDATPGSADLTFFEAVLDDVERTVCVDERRVFVAGLSNGAFMTSAVACQDAGRIAAAAPVAGIQDIAGCRPTRPVPVVAFHGTADPYVSFDGGFGPAVANLPTPNGTGRLGAAAVTTKGPSITEQTTAWARRNGCSPPPGDVVVAPDVTL